MIDFVSVLRAELFSVRNVIVSGTLPFPSSSIESMI